MMARSGRECPADSPSAVYWQEHQLQDLQDAVARGRAIFVVGTGLSISGSAGASTASWIGLLEESLDYISDRKMANEQWRPMIDHTLAYARSTSDTTALVSVAGMVQSQIKLAGDFAYAKWLRETVGELKPVDESWAKALDAVSCPILTTNYDSLIEQSTGRQSATWESAGEIQRILANNSNSVGHLHGLWSEPDSVILSDRDYTKLLASQTAQDLQKAASALKSIIYVGVGSGLEDPNFSRLIDWHRRSFEVSQHRHFRLCRESELSDLLAEHRADHILPVAYGQDFVDLPGFLASISPSSSTPVLLSASGLVLDSTQLARDALADQVRIQSIVCENSDDRETRSVEELIVPPVLYPVSNENMQAAEQLAAKKKIKRSDPFEVSRLNGVVLIVGDENSGLTTALQWLLDHAAAESLLPPILLDFNKFPKGGRPLVQQLRSQARNLSLLPAGVDQLEDAVIAIDNVTPFAGKRCDQMIEDLIKINPRQVFLGCRSDQEPEFLERLTSAGLTPEVRYVGRFSRRDVVKLVRLATHVRPEQIASRVVAVLAQQNLPHTPFIVSLLASILLAGNAIQANSSHTTLLDQYLSQLLGRGNVDEDARWSLDSGLREAVLADLAKLFVEQRAGSIQGSRVSRRIEDYFEARDISESAFELLSYFSAQRVLRSDGNMIRFSHHSYLYLFAAKAAADDSQFRTLILEDPTLFAPIIRHYAALKRQDSDLLARMELYLDDSQHLTEGRPALRQVDIVEAPEELEIEFLADSTHTPSSEPSTSDLHEEEETLPYNEPEAFPLELPEDLPPAYRYSIVLDVVSTALRDCFQVPDPELKARLLRKVLIGWGRYLALVEADTGYREALQQVADTTAEALGIEDPDEREHFAKRLTAVFPPLMVMSGIASSLSSRKLLKALERAIEDKHFTADPEGAISAAFMVFNVREPGWAKQLSAVSAEHLTLEVIADFFLNLCSFTYFEMDVNPEDDLHLLRYISELSVAGFKFKSEVERKTQRGRVEQAIRRQRSQRKAIRASKPRELTVGSTEVPLDA